MRDMLSIHKTFSKEGTVPYNLLKKLKVSGFNCSWYIYKNDKDQCPGFQILVI